MLWPPEWREELLADLKRSKPRYAIRGRRLSNVAVSVGMTEELLPEVREYIEANYYIEVSFNSIDTFGDKPRCLPSGKESRKPAPLGFSSRDPLRRRGKGLKNGGFVALPSLRPSFHSGLEDDSERSEESRSGLFSFAFVQDPSKDPECKEGEGH